MDQPEAAAERAEQFLAELDEQDVAADLYATPLLFTLWLTLWYSTRPDYRLPATNRAGLYRAAEEFLLADWEESKPGATDVEAMLHLPATTMHAVLERLACDMQAAAKDQCYTGELLGLLLETKGLRRSGFARMQIEEVERHLTRRAGILALVSPTAYHYRFLHASFREHLAACELTHKDPANRQPPVAAERRFPGGMLHYVRENPQHWWNVAHLAADELMAQGREKRTVGAPGRDVPALCPARAAARARRLLALAIAEKLKPFKLPDAGWKPVRVAAKRALVDITTFPQPAERDIAGRLLGRLPDLDTRRGVGLRQRLPAIVWVEVKGGGRPFPVSERHACGCAHLLDRTVSDHLRPVSGVCGRKAGLCG